MVQPPQVRCTCTSPHTCPSRRLPFRGVALALRRRAHRTTWVPFYKHPSQHPTQLPCHNILVLIDCLATGCASATFRSSDLVGCSPLLGTGSFSPLCPPFLSTGPHADPAASLTGAPSRSPRVTPKDPHLYPQQRGSGPLPPISDPPVAASWPPPPPFGSGNIELQVCPEF